MLTPEPSLWNTLVGIAIVVAPPLLTIAPFLIYGARKKWTLRQYALPTYVVSMLWVWFYGKFVFKVAPDVLTRGMILVGLYGIALLWTQIRADEARRRRKAEEAAKEDQDSNCPRSS